MAPINRNTLKTLVQDMPIHPEGTRAEALHLAEMLDRLEPKDEYIERCKRALLRIGNGHYEPQDKTDLESDALRSLEADVELWLDDDD